MSRMRMLICFGRSEVMTTLPGIPFVSRGTMNSSSYTSFNVWNVQNIPERRRKKMKIRNCLFQILEKQFLNVLGMLLKTFMCLRGVSGDV